MRGAKKGPRGLGLCFLAVLGFTAFAAAGAQGQGPGKFLDAGGELAVGTTLTGAQEGTGSLLVAKLNVAIECAAIDFEEGVVTAKLTAELKEHPVLPGTAHVKLLALNCIALTAALAPLTSCKIANSKTLIAKVKLLARLASAAHGNEPFILAEPLTEPTYATTTIENETGKFCSIAGVYNLTGTLALKVLAGNKNPQLLIPYANQALLGDAGLTLGTHATTLDGSTTVELTGPVGLAGAAFGVC